ncbi:MAG: AAA family ATPase [Sporolactobacillus sp.]|jgi:uncharacterized protein YhaN|nr:AAA family ATPase [Sporolactobacillus sp.]
MKIRSLEIGRFGRFENRKIDLPDDPLVVVYGRNEAGKSTMMQFILCTLFGYPPRNQLMKEAGGNADQLAGTLVFTGDDGQRYRLTRTFSENGKPSLYDAAARPADLSTMLRGVDRSLYESVFCFGLDGLRDIAKKKAADLNDLLLGAGMTGSRRLSQLEKALDQATGALFKPKGKKPELNQLFSKLRQSSEEAGRWEKKMDDYQRMRTEAAAAKKSMTELEVRRRKLQSRYEDWMRYAGVRKMITDRRTVETEIHVLENEAEAFPADGRSRCAAIDHEIATTEKALNDLTVRIRRVDEATAALSYREDWIKAEGRLEAFFNAARRDEEDEQALNRLEEEQRGIRSNYQALLEKLGAGWDDARIDGVRIGIDFREQLRRLLADWRSLVEEERRLAARLDEKRRQMSELEDGKKRLAARSATLRRPGSLAAYWLPIAIAAVATALAAILSAVLIGPAAGLIALLLGALLTGLFSLAARRSGDGSELSTERRLTDERLAETKKQLVSESQQAAQKTQERQRVQRQLAVYMNENGYGRQGPEYAEETVRLAREARELRIRLLALDEQAKVLRQRRTDFTDERQHLGEMLSLPQGSASYIEQQFKLEKDKSLRVRELRSKRDVYLKELSSLSKQRQDLQNRRRQLFSAAGATDYEAFIKQADLNDRLSALRSKAKELGRQLLETAGGPQAAERFVSEMNRGTWTGMDEADFKNQLAAVDSKLKAYRERLLEKQAQLRGLEEHDTYRDVLDERERLLTEARRLAGKWAALQLAQWAVARAKDRYRRQKLPKVLREASRYFKWITGDVYETVRLDEENGFTVGRRDGIHFPAVMLSRGTAEQLYLSIRLALAGVFAVGEHLPLIVDEGFVNFDRSRSTRVWSLLNKIAATRQVVLFTCHKTDYMDNHSEAVLRLAEVDNRSAIR